jgi:NADH dehydrogenase/NADH:ubiquinone oxidoreductase subunit G
MHRKVHCAVAILAVAMSVLGISAIAQTPADAVSSVPALETFHDVIFKIWHEAWPKKDTALLQKLLPDVEKGIAEVASAPLPGILREKKAAWEDGVKKLQIAGSDYKAAAAAKDDAKLLAAAEALHSRFEGLMRAIRPAMKELDDFHASLYMLYHHYLPKWDMTKIFSSADELAQKMAALNAARLPERLKQKEPEFQAARAKLSSSVDDLQKIKTISSTQTIQNKVETVHSDYQALDRIFE